MCSEDRYKGTQPDFVLLSVDPNYYVSVPFNGEFVFASAIWCLFQFVWAEQEFCCTRTTLSAAIANFVSIYHFNLFLLCFVSVVPFSLFDKQGARIT